MEKVITAHWVRLITDDNELGDVYETECPECGDTLRLVDGWTLPQVCSCDRNWMIEISAIGIKPKSPL